jgi:hypothetical protein
MTTQPDPNAQVPQVKPCPFCGWRACIITGPDGWRRYSCDNTECSNDAHMEFVDWNTRTPEPDLAAEVERLRGQLGRISGWLSANIHFDSEEEKGALLSDGYGWIDEMRKWSDERAEKAEAEVERLKATAAHMTACRALLNVPSDEVLAEAIREKLADVERLTAKLAEIEGPEPYSEEMLERRDLVMRINVRGLEIERLTRECDEARTSLTASLGFATEALGDAYQSVSVSVRENIAGSIRALKLALAAAQERERGLREAIEARPHEISCVGWWGDNTRTLYANCNCWKAAALSDPKNRHPDAK